MRISDWSSDVCSSDLKQILAGGPITLTHPDITRYFMTIPEAAQLVLQAGSMGESGSVFLLDMGEAVRIQDLAERMVHLYGLTRSAARRVGKECVSPCRSRWSPYL